MYDLLLKNGSVVDGSGQKAFMADVAVKDGKIVKVAPQIEGEAVEVIDARGLTVSPGFIDWHSHSDLSVLMGWDAPNILLQGVTFEIAGHCGVSVTPLPRGGEKGDFGSTPERAESIQGKGGTFKAFAEELDAMALPTNFATFIGHGNLRANAMGYDNRVPTGAEMEAMKAALREAMDNGAMGFSTGLIYPPGSYSKPAELEELAMVLGDYDGAMYTSHMRSEGDRVVESVKETLEVGRKAGVPVVISHHKVAGRHNKGKSVETLRLMHEARESGQTVYLDQYPYDGGGTSLMAALPPKYASQGPQALLEKLKDPAIRAEITELLKKPGEDFENLIYGSTMDGVILFTDVKPEVNGVYLSEYARQQGKDPYEAMYDLMLEVNGQIGAIYRMISVWDMENILKDKWTMAGIDGAQENKVENGHPRGNATYPKLIGTMCRDKGMYALEECIHRFTGLAAMASGFEEKGLIREGCDADIVVFDFNTISGKADYGTADAPNEGIEYVFVNGVKAAEKGQITGEKGGKFLRRPGK